MKVRKPYYKFKGYLAENNIKQKDVAVLINMSSSTFSKKLSGKGSDFSIQDLKEICQHLKIKAEIFFD